MAGEFQRCPICREYGWGVCRCKPFEAEMDYSHKNDGSGYEDGGTVHGTSAENAAQLWAKEDDERGDYTIVSGSAARLRLTDQDGKVTEWTVTGEAEPVYYAAEIKLMPEGA